MEFKSEVGGMTLVEFQSLEKQEVDDFLKNSVHKIAKKGKFRMLYKADAQGSLTQKSYKHHTHTPCTHTLTFTEHPHPMSCPYIFCSWFIFCLSILSSLYVTPLTQTDLRKSKKLPPKVPCFSLKLLLLSVSSHFFLPSAQISAICSNCPAQIRKGSWGSRRRKKESWSSTIRRCLDNLSLASVSIFDPATTNFSPQSGIDSLKRRNGAPSPLRAPQASASRSSVYSSSSSSFVIFGRIRTRTTT